MIVLAAIGGFGAFLLFLLLGLIALPVTAALDKSLGKEKGLLIYAVGLLLFTFFLLKPAGPGDARVSARREANVPVEDLVTRGDPLARAAIDHEAARNVFEPYSDTRELPPVSLEAPPWVAIEFALPPTIPGPAPGFRRVLRGSRPSATAGDGSAIPEVPEAQFTDYQRQPEDVYDWMAVTGRPVYIYITSLRDGTGTWHHEGTKGYEALKWLVQGQGEGWEKVEVRYAYVGSPEAAAKLVAPLDVINARQKNLTTKAATEQDGGWRLRRTVANLYHEALVRQGIDPDADLARVRNPDALRRAAKEMAEVGRTGKEDRAGWRRAAELIEASLEEIRANRGPSERAEALLELLEAYRALRDEQAVLRTLAEYMRTSDQSAQACTWLGQLHLQGMQLAEEALGYFQAALDKDSRHGPALIGQGDALSMLGEHELAEKSYAKAVGDEARLRRATAELRLGKLESARGMAESVLANDPTHLEAMLVRACALYGLGDLETARGGFEQVATAEGGRELRAMACYDLGLTCLRMGQTQAASSAFDACEEALKRGASSGPTPDETVSPSMGRALVAYATGDDSAMRTHLDKARREAGRSSYVEMFSGMTASLEGNDASAIRSLEAALRNAPRYGELDAWLAKTNLRLGARARATGAPADDVAATLERAIAFANRAAERARRRDPNAYHARLREVLVRLGAEHLPSKQRYGLALEAVNKILANTELREQPAALALAGYCQYQLGNYEECIRKLQAVIDVVPADQEDNPWAAWRAYAGEQLTAVKHWLALEEKVVVFKGSRLEKDWENSEVGGPRIEIEDGELRIYGRANKDAKLEEPTVFLEHGDLFTREAFETLTMRVKIPREVRGTATNNVSFGVELRAGGRGRRGGKKPGIGVWYDRNKLAVRIHGGQIKRYKEGDVTRLDPPQDWPADDVILRIVREDADAGTIAIYLDDVLVVRDNVSTFKTGRGKASLWIGGYSTAAQDFDVRISDIRIVRRKGP